MLSKAVTGRRGKRKKKLQSPSRHLNKAIKAAVKKKVRKQGNHKTLNCH